MTNHPKRSFLHTMPFSIAVKDGVFQGSITCGEPTRRIVVGARTRFFSRDYAGCPTEETARGRMLDIPKERDPFWQAFYCWTRQGERMDGDLCVWEPMPPRRVKRLDRRNSLLIHQPAEWMDVDGEVVE